MSGLNIIPNNPEHVPASKNVPASNDSTCTEACMKLLNSQIYNDLDDEALHKLKENYLEKSKCWLKGKDKCPYNIAVKNATIEDMREYLEKINQTGGKRKSLRSHKKSKKRKQTKHMKKSKNGKKSKTQKVKRSRH